MLQVKHAYPKIQTVAKSKTFLSDDMTPQVANSTHTMKNA
jgi:hypothetical protein